MTSVQSFAIKQAILALTSWYLVVKFQIEKHR